MIFLLGYGSLGTDLCCRVTVKLKCGEWGFEANRRVTLICNPYYTFLRFPRPPVTYLIQPPPGSASFSFNHLFSSSTFILLTSNFSCLFLLPSTSFYLSHLLFAMFCIGYRSLCVRARYFLHWFFSEFVFRCILQGLVHHSLDVMFISLGEIGL